MRSLLSVIQSFVRSVGSGADGRSSTQTARSCRGAGSKAGCYAASFAPSSVYAPSNIGSIASGANPAQPHTFKPTTRIASRAFDPEGSSELKIAVGDRLTIKHDPECDAHNVHRWVYGENHRTKELGWLPLSHAQEEVEDEEDPTPTKDEEYPTPNEYPAGWAAAPNDETASAAS